MNKKQDNLDWQIQKTANAEKICTIIKDDLPQYVKAIGENNFIGKISDLLEMSNLNINHLLFVNPVKRINSYKKSVVNFISNDQKLCIAIGEEIIKCGILCNITIEYECIDRKITSMAKLINNELYSYSIGDLEHTTSGDYLFYMREKDNMYLDSVKGNTILMSIYHFADYQNSINQFKLMGVSDSNKVEFVSHNNYQVETFSKLISYFQQDPNMVMQMVKNPNISKTINYLSYNSDYSFTYNDGEYHLNLSKPHSLESATYRNGEVYEVTDVDVEYFKKIEKFDFSEFYGWAKSKRLKNS